MIAVTNVGARNTNNDLPRRWEKACVRDLVELINGHAFKPSDWSTQGSPIIRIQNLNNPTASYNYYSDTLPKKFSVHAGDLLFAWSGTPGTSFGAHIWNGPKAWLNQHIFKVVFDEICLNKRFLRLAINQNLNEYIAAAHGGAGLAHITKGRFEESEIQIPPYAEQQRIVAEIEKQFTRLDAAVASLKQVRAKVKRYRASVLKAACEGRLVPTEAELARAEGRDYEPAGVLLQRILKERRSRWEVAEIAKKGKANQSDDCGWKAKYRQPCKPDLTDTAKPPEGWVIASVDQLTSNITSGSRGWSKYYGGGSATFIMAQNVRPGRLDFGSRQVIDPPPDHPERARTQVRRGDLLVTIVGANTGDVAAVEIELPEHYVCQSVSLMRPVAVETAAFVSHYLASEENGQRQYRRYIYGAGRPHLSFEQLKMTAVLLPPVAEQDRIVAEIERRISVISELESSIEANLRRAERLRQSILKRAFEGKLVPQDPNDEPASVLLERIRTERAAKVELAASRKGGKRTKGKRA